MPSFYTVFGKGSPYGQFIQEKFVQLFLSDT